MEALFSFDKKTPIWIYGRGFLGKPLYLRLKKYNYNIEGFIDRNPSNNGLNENIKVVSPNYLDMINSEAIVIITFQNIHEHELIADELIKHNITKIIYLNRYSEYYPDTFDYFNGLVYGQDVKDFMFPYATSHSKNIDDFYREYDNYSVVEVPIQILFSAPLYRPIGMDDSEKQMDYSYNVSAVYEYKALLDLMLTGSYDANYLDRYLNRLHGNGRSVSEFLNNRLLIYSDMMKEYRKTGIVFFRNAPSHADYDDKHSRFVLSDGHHRACLLASLSQKLIPIRISKKDYKKWADNEYTDKVLDYIQHNSITQLYTPLMFSTNIEIKVTTEKDGRLNASALYDFYGKLDCSKYEVLDINSCLSYYSRIFYRLGVKKVTSVETREMERELAYLINYAENCNGIDFVDDIPKNKQYQIVIWCNDIFVELEDIELIRKVLFVCEKYFVISIPLDENNRLVKNLIVESGFNNPILINTRTDNGKIMEMMIFEKKY